MTPADEVATWPPLPQELAEQIARLMTDERAA